MKKKLFTLLCIGMLCFLTSCGKNNSIVEDSSENKAPAKLFERHPLDKKYAILVEKETGICYLEYKNCDGYVGYYGITVMLNPDGTPKIWEKD